MRRLAAGVLVALAWGAAVFGAGGARAQIENPLDQMTTTSTTEKASPTTTSPMEPILPRQPAPAPAPAPAPGPALPPVPGNGSGEGIVPPEGAGPFPPELAALMRSVKRSGPRNTQVLMDGLKGLTDLGMPLDEAIRVGMGRFPVAGYAGYTHDWWFPRFGPGWRLHMGTDLFAPSGTPLRSPAQGVVRMVNGGLGGRSTYVVQSDGTYFYMAHLDGWPKALIDGQVVNVGDVVGYVGTTGNATGSSPHLHFEVHPAVKVVTVGKGRRQTTKVVPFPVAPGTTLPAADPKALLDEYLQEAIDALPSVVAAYRSNLPVPAPAAVEAESIESDLVAPSLLAAGRRLRLSDAAPTLSVPLLGFAFLLMLIVGTLTPVLGTRGALPSTRGSAGLHGPRSAPTAALETSPASPRGARRRNRKAWAATRLRRGRKQPRPRPPSACPSLESEPPTHTRPQ